MNKVLVTGADGFIGSHLTEKLVRKPETVGPLRNRSLSGVPRTSEVP